ncbi:hypothetical protein [Kinneretia aquatilis]|uniref:hypothetical protein n=1 Tax=Kinneretia aquatilis TaxID=2070761 RepID=UPI001057533A|nr:hypothetical protein [Paucibacter aquatile]
MQNGSIKEVQIKPQNGFLNCFYVDIPSNASARHVVAQSYNLSAFNLRELTMSADGQLVPVKENWSDASAIVVSEVVNSGRVFFSVRPSNNDRLSKNVSVIAGIHEGLQVIHFGIEDVVGSNVPPPKECTNPRKQCDRLSPLPKLDRSPLVNCSASTAPPSDKNPNFDINAHLDKFKTGRLAIDRLPPSLRESTRAMIMTKLFAPGQKYDLKKNNNPSMLSGEQFGNWFFGAAAAQIGYTQSQAVKAGAVVQQYQNYTNPNHPAHNDAIAMTGGILYAARTGLGDNPGDADRIKGGHDYATTVYEADPNRKAVSNSCDKAPPISGGPGDVGGASSVGTSSSWQGGSVSPAPGCYGKCGSSSYLNVGPTIPKIQSSN